MNASQHRLYRKLCKDYRKENYRSQFSPWGFCQERDVELTLRRPSSKILGLKKSKGFDRMRRGYCMMIRNELEDSQLNRSQYLPHPA